MAWRKSMAKKATLDGVVLAEATEVVSLEGSAYFPPETINWEHLTESDHTTTCPWKGQATYFDAVIDGATHRNVGWTYRTPSPQATAIADHVAFWGKVRVGPT
jgi:uncharacterized protein (DUF427 family)